MYLLFRMQKFPHKDHGDGLYYNAVLPFLIGNSRALSTAWNHDDPYGRWETPQKAGTCFFRCVLCTLKYLLRRYGLKEGNIKVFFHAVRQSFLSQAIADLKDPVFTKKPLHHSQQKLIQLASKQTAYSAVKEGKAGRLDADSLKQVKAMCEEVESLLKNCGTVVPSVAEVPLLSFADENNPIKFEPWKDGLIDGFSNAYEGNTDGFKGDDDPAPVPIPVDYLSGPSKVEISSPSMILKTLTFLKTAVKQSFLQPNKTENIYEVISLIENVFINTLPCPQLSEQNVSSCPWHSRDGFKKDERKHLLELLEWCSTQYTSAREAIPTHYYNEGVRVVTHALILCAYWAILRQPATDFKQEEEKLHKELLQYPVFFPNSNGRESFKDSTAKLPFLSPSVILARSKLCKEMECVKRLQFKSSICLFDSIVRGEKSWCAKKNHPMLKVMAKFNSISCYRNKGQLSTKTPPKKDRHGKPIKYSEEARNLGWLCVTLPNETSHMRDFYGLRNMILRYISGVNYDMRTRKEGENISPAAGALSLHFKCTYDEGDKKGEIELFVRGKSPPKHDAKFPQSPANLGAYKEFQNISGKTLCEDDVLFAKTLPTFDATLSSEDAERLCSYLTAPYLRIPMLLDYFANGRIGNLFNKDLRKMLFHSLFSPGNWVDDNLGTIDNIPCEADKIGCENGILWNELEKGPQGCLDPLIRLLNEGAKQCVDDYKSTYVDVFYTLSKLQQAYKNVYWLLYRR